MSALRKVNTEPADSGVVPDRDPFLGPAFIKVWAEQNAEIIGSRPKAFDTPFRHSSAGWCGYALSLDVLGVPESDPPSMADSWNMTLGTKIHDWAQGAVQEAFPGAVMETKLLTGNGLGSGHSDIFIAVVAMRDGKRVVVELKSPNGWAYKTAVGAQGVATGPKHDHVLQLGLNVRAHDADLGVIWYLSRELINKSWAQKLYGTKTILIDGTPLWVIGQFSAEWSYDRETLDPLVDAELERWAEIRAQVRRGEQVPRHVPGMPEGAVVTNPRTGIWQLVQEGGLTESGKTWQCMYCRHASDCTRALENEQ